MVLNLGVSETNLKEERRKKEIPANVTKTYILFDAPIWIPKQQPTVSPLPHSTALSLTTEPDSKSLNRVEGKNNTDEITAFPKRSKEHASMAASSIVRINNENWKTRR
jgi:hypothetical protein